jgi:hypothetical protein
MQKLYDTLLAQGSVSRDGAYEAARTVEKTDITDITAAMDGLTAPDVLAVYGHLLTGSTESGLGPERGAHRVDASLRHAPRPAHLDPVAGTPESSRRIACIPPLSVR